ncbi:YrzI family small protein [Ectobacillus ponti]|uniref:YrzI family small protein n=1 Tax=Ectobacillus ponti TaxID=2961894 RepID=A0AA42BQE9_9BACI|nr:YrzI family small protein [Ectobacillus ponti]MCP8968379.1 YrzI family small protein [Ectobacillus ponti]
MKFHVLSLVVVIQRRRKSMAAVRHEKSVQQLMSGLKARQAEHCRFI